MSRSGLLHRGGRLSKLFVLLVLTLGALAFAPSALAAAPANLSAPQIEGKAEEGKTLTTSTGEWASDTALTYAYQWLRCDTGGANCSVIAGATSPSYVLTTAEVGHTVRSRVTATNADGSAAADSAQTRVVQPSSSSDTQSPPTNLSPPVISGKEYVVDAIISTSSGEWLSPKPVQYSYQWLRCDSYGAACVAITGATKTSYKIVLADVDRTLRSQVTATNATGATSSRSEPTPLVAGAPGSPGSPENTALPVISGTAQEGQVLTASSGAWTNSPTSYAYQWRRCDAAGVNCVAISGATAQSYVVQTADVDQTLRVRVTASNAKGSNYADSAQTAVVLPAPPVNTALPVVSGEAREGQTLTTSNGSWSSSRPVSFSYQWLRCDSAGANCAAIAGATGQSYLAQAADIDQTLRAQVTASNSGGATSATSNPSSVVLAAPPANTAKPALSGEAREGQTLTTSNGSWTSSRPLSFSYQWLRCDASGANCAAIAGATSQSYLVQAADIDLTLRAQVTASNAGGSASASSDATPVVLPAPPVNTVIPVVSGQAKEGETLTTSDGSWTSSRPLSFSYQWLRCDAATGETCVEIAGATSSSYVVQTADNGSRLRSRVTATNSGGSTAAQSATTGIVAPLILTYDQVVRGDSPAMYWRLGESAGRIARDSSGFGRDGSYYDGYTLAAPGLIKGPDTAAAFDHGGAQHGYNPALNTATFSFELWLKPTGDLSGHHWIAYGFGSDRGRAGFAVFADWGAVNFRLGTAAGDVTVSDPTGLFRLERDRTYHIVGTYDGAVASLYVNNKILDAKPVAYQPSVDAGLVLAFPGSAPMIGIFDEVARYGQALSAADIAEHYTIGRGCPCPPVNTSPPVVSGEPMEGRLLSTSNGEWQNEPTSYAYQWLRCDSAGDNCAGIVGAVGQTYRLTVADVGSRIRSQVSAVNADGSATATSAPTGIVQSAALLPPYANVVLADNPVGYWRLGEAAGTLAADAGSAGRHGTYYGTPTLGVSGAVAGDTAVALGGDGDYMLTPNLASAFSSETVTLEVWFNANAPGAIITEQGDANTNTRWWDTQIEILASGEVKARVWNLESVSLGTVAFGTWNHAVLRYNKTILTLDGFLNGTESLAKSIGDRQAPFEFGVPQYYALGAQSSTSLGSGAWFNGVVDEFAVYNTALSAAQVVAHYDAR